MPARFRLSKDVSSKPLKARGPPSVSSDKYPRKDGRPTPKNGRDSYKTRDRQPFAHSNGPPLSRRAPPSSGSKRPWDRESPPHNASKTRSLDGGDLDRRERTRAPSYAGNRTAGDRDSTKDKSPALREPSHRASVSPVATHNFHHEIPAQTLPLIPTFSSPPLLPGLISSLRDVLGPSPRPTRIQALSLAHFFPTPKPSSSKKEDLGIVAQDTEAFVVQKSGTTLLASETGSGKSYAYLLPVLQSLKQTESLANPSALGPRALILAPTHELSRQLSFFAKSLSHNIKLRTMCMSNPNASSSGVKSLRDMGAEHDDTLGQPKVARAVDVMVATPSKVIDLAGIHLESRGGGDKEVKEGRESPSINLAGVEWLVVDEADVLLG